MLPAVRTILLQPQVQPSFIANLVTGLFASALGSPTPTFTRASTAYFQYFSGLYVPVLSGEARFQGARRVKNIVINAEDITGSGWAVANAMSRTATTATFVNANSSLSHASFAMTTVNTKGIFVVRFVASGTAQNVQFELVDGSDGSDSKLSTIAITTTPTIYSIVGNFSASSTFSGNMLFVINRLGTVAAGSTLNFGKLSIEDATGQANQNPSEYVSVGVVSSPFFGANVDGVKYFSTLNGNTVSSNVVTEAVGAPIATGASGVASWAPVDAGGPFGYLAEGARADVLGTTAAIRRTMSDIGWVATTTTVATTVGIDGVTASGARLTATGANSTILFTPGLGAGVRTYSVWIKRITGTGNIQITADVADGYVTKTLTANYAQYQVTSTSAVPVVGFKIATSGDVIDVDFNTLEAATFANPTPIPVNVSKAADVLTYPSAGNVGTVGSIYLEGARDPNNLIFGGIIAIGGATLADEVYMTNVSNAGYMFTRKTAGTNGDIGPVAGWINGAGKMAGSYATNSVNLSVSGSAVSSDTTADIPSLTQITIGQRTGTIASPWWGTIRNVRIWLSALSTSQLTRTTT